MPILKFILQVTYGYLTTILLQFPDRFGENGHFHRVQRPQRHGFLGEIRQNKIVLFFHF